MADRWPSLFVPPRRTWTVRTFGVQQAARAAFPLMQQQRDETMKYVMLEVTLAGGTAPPFKLPVIFPDKLIHKDMATAARKVAWSTWPRCSVTVVSAGEIQLDGVECFGKSETLEVESRGIRDADTIETYNYMHGIET